MLDIQPRMAERLYRGIKPPGLALEPLGYRESAHPILLGKARSGLLVVLGARRSRMCAAILPLDLERTARLLGVHPVLASGAKNPIGVTI